MKLRCLLVFTIYWNFTGFPDTCCLSLLRNILIDITLDTISDIKSIRVLTGFGKAHERAGEDRLIEGSILVADEETGRTMDPNYMSKNDLIKVLKDEGWDDTSMAINRFGDSKLSYGRYPTDRFDKTCFFSFLVCRKAR